MSERDHSNVESETEPPPLITTPAHSSPRFASAFAWATFTAAAGLVAMVLAFLLRVYYNERVFSGIRDFEEQISLTEISKFSAYSLSISLVLCFVAFVLAVSALKAILIDGEHEAILRDLKDVFGVLLMLGIAMVACSAIAAALLIFRAELAVGLSGDIGYVDTRMWLYLPMIARILAATALLIVANALRTASVRAAPSTHGE